MRVYQERIIKSYHHVEQNLLTYDSWPVYHIGILTNLIFKINPFSNVLAVLRARWTKFSRVLDAQVPITILKMDTGTRRISFGFPIRQYVKTL